MKDSSMDVGPNSNVDANQDSASGIHLPSRHIRRWMRSCRSCSIKLCTAEDSRRRKSSGTFVNGTWLGQPLHAVLTDVPVGAWTAAMVFDALDLALERREFALAADTAIVIGLAGAAGAAATGLTDWSDVDPPARRIGFLHGLLNLSGTALFATSLLLRKQKSRSAGRMVGALGYAVMAYAAHLGGKMVYEQRVGVDRTSGQVFPEEFVAVLPDASLADGKPTRAMYQGTPILLVRRGVSSLCDGGDVLALQRPAVGRQGGGRDDRVPLSLFAICVGGRQCREWAGGASAALP